MYFDVRDCFIDLNHEHRNCVVILKIRHGNALTRTPCSVWASYQVPQSAQRQQAVIVPGTRREPIVTWTTEVLKRGVRCVQKRGTAFRTSVKVPRYHCFDSRTRPHKSPLFDPALSQLISQQRSFLLFVLVSPFHIHLGLPRKRFPWRFSTEIQFLYLVFWDIAADVNFEMFMYTHFVLCAGGVGQLV